MVRLRCTVQRLEDTVTAVYCSSRKALDTLSSPGVSHLCIDDPCVSGLSGVDCTVRNANGFTAGMRAEQAGHHKLAMVLYHVEVGSYIYTYIYMHRGPFCSGCCGRESAMWCLSLRLCTVDCLEPIGRTRICAHRV